MKGTDRKIALCRARPGNEVTAKKRRQIRLWHLAAIIALITPAAGFFYFESYERSLPGAGWPQRRIPDVSGKWKSRVRFSLNGGQKWIDGTMDLVQNGTSITGWADGEANGQFPITGTLIPPDQIQIKIMFDKNRQAPNRESAINLVGTGFCDNSCYGLLLVEVGKKFGYVDRTGSLSIPLQFYSAQAFSEGLALVSLEPMGKWWDSKDYRVKTKYGFIDTNGTLVIPPAIYEYPRSFSDGLAYVELWEDDEARSLFIDKDGKVVLDFKGRKRVGDFHEGLAPIEIVIHAP